MSVINRMLAELDARRAPAPAQAAGPAAAPLAVRPRGSHRLKLIVLLGAGLGSAAALGNWPAWFGTPPRVPQPPGIVAAAPPAVAQPLPAASSAPAEAAASASGMSHTLSEPRPALRSRPRRTALAAAAAAAPQAPASAPAAQGHPTQGPVSAAAPQPRVDKQPVVLNAAQQAALAYRQATELATVGASTQAIDMALGALRQDPGHTAARQLAAVLLFELRRYDDARTVLSEGLARGPQDPALVYLMARLLVESGQQADALQLLDMLSAPGADALGLRAAILAQQGRYAEALPVYEAAVRLQPEHAPWWLGLGLALDAQGRGAEARLAFQRARALGSLRGDLLVYVEQKLAATR